MPKGSIKAPGSSATTAARMLKRAYNAGKLQGKRIDAATRKLNDGAAARKQARVTARDIRSDASVGGAMARTKENPVTALKRRAASKKK